MEIASTHFELDRFKTTIAGEDTFITPDTRKWSQRGGQDREGHLLNSTAGECEFDSPDNSHSVWGAQSAGEGNPDLHQCRSHPGESQPAREPPTLPRE